MLEDLSQKLELALKKIRGQGKLTESNVSDTVREIRRILLDADVNYKVTKDFIERVRQKAMGQEVMVSITPGQLITKIIYDELVELLGGSSREVEINPSGKTIFLVVGLQGSGKTTFSGKLAKRFKAMGKNPLLVAADIYRPAAIEQLKTLGQQTGVPVFSLEVKDARKIATDALKYADENRNDLIIIDTAGRLHVDDELMTEVADIKGLVKPTEVLFVVDSMTGQDAVNSAKAFNDIVNFDGIVLTKMDGDARGGCALSIREVVGKPIKFISTGEKLDAIDVFHPDRLASRILGKGDVVSLVEKAQEAYDEREAEEMEEKLRKNRFDLDDFLKQIRMIKRMGSLSSLMAMIPGIPKHIKNQKVDDNALVKVEAMINSMTKKERGNPKILNGSRRRRIARGSGTSIQDVNRLIKQFTEMQTMITRLNKQNFFRKQK
ncbi:MAG: signal recognition particle protein [Ignavibacteriales bacterium]|nr:MAG: signal recognition particle protein [Ignavibacteriaceae bacterium]MBW7873970.1 signal recognition particle protein [Ignavibacteria bacterium]MCZ2143271.1 signal recognition particle protein [Ignavibacteriales bacterium]OQY77250.1 MAG: signal recognition particle protein [Ignavibacteriales bacterium UTCHB3]MBV6444153.1 Signal recognition particle protein [Ignavibacteriaceae bacterium]